MNELFAFVEKFGMTAAIAVAVLYGGWRLICRIIDMLESANKRWQEVVERLEARFQAHEETNKEAHQYQRGEHEKLAEQQNRQIESLKGIQEAIGRLNGHKDV